MTLTSRTPTLKASSYLQQLCKHWSHKFEVEFTPQHGVIALPLGRVELAASPEALDIRLEPADAAQADKMKEVVEAHLNRFAFKEAPLPFAWKAA